ncbi:MAG: hypothetical protein K2X02_03105 [Alphaproteobacteria bacterium]|nr:hypothetical protein [Alphaproteobacteria bacterium]
MKRYLTLLTLSFLSTSTLVKAGKFNIPELSTIPEERTTILHAKADRLQKNIDNTENADLKQALTQQREVVNTLLHIPLTEATAISGQYWLYDSAKKKKDGINARIYPAFLHEMRHRDARSQFAKIYRTLRAEIYAPESQEDRDLDAAIRAFGGTFGEEVSKDTLKAAGRYLKMQRLIAPHIQKADKIIDEYMANAKRITADFNRIKESGDERDLKILEHWLPYRSDEWRIVRQALGRLSSIGISLVPESDPNYQYPPMYRAEYREHQIYDILGYKALEDKLAPILAPYRQSRQDTPDFIASVFSGASDYAKLEEALASRYSNIYDAPPEVRDFLGIMRRIRDLPFLLTTLKSLQPEAQKKFLDDPVPVVWTHYSSAYQEFIPTPGEVSMQDAPDFIASVFSGASDYAKLEEALASRYSYYYNGMDYEVRDFLGIMREIRELPFLLIRLKELHRKTQELLDNPPSLGLAPAPTLLESTPRYHMGKVSPYPLSGFSAPEGAHRWTVGKKASITLPLAEMGFPSQISFFDTRALVTGSHPQNLIVKVNGNEVKRYIYTLEDNNKRIDIPLPEAGPATIEFEMPDAASPSDLGIGADKRALGISFREFQAYSTPRFHMGKVSPYPLSGFSALESSHRWTVGKKATITLPLEVMAHRPSSISFLNTKGFITGSRPQNLIVKVNGGIVKHYVYTPGNNNQTLEIPLPKDGPAIIEFEMPDAASPSDLGIGADKRELGISFGEVKFQY